MEPKRFFDIAFALLLLSILAVPMVLLAITVIISSKGPALFWTERVGQNCKLFLMPKFRTMYLNTPISPTDQLKDPNSHITKLGHFLRRTSLDELPQLYSVLTGDMSLVGPRPVLPSQEYLVQKRQETGVYALRPGITGWAQINGRDDVCDDDKVSFDSEYVQRQSTMFDILILCRTISYVLGSKGIRH